MTRELDVCPHCDSAEIHRRVHKQPNWKCLDCRKVFDDAKRRETEAPQDTLAHRPKDLSDADPEDYGLSPLGERQ